MTRVPAADFGGPARSFDWTRFGQYPGFRPQLPPQPLLIRGTQSRGSDTQETRVKVQVVPPQSKHLTLPQPKRQSNGPPCTVRTILSGSQDQTNLINRIRTDLFGLDTRRFSQRRGVARHMTAPYRLPQRAPHRAVHLMSSRGTRTIRHHRLVQPFQVLRLQPVKSMLSDTFLPLVNLRPSPLELR
jgi:hypothetical protein